MTELEALTRRRLAHHAGEAVPWTDADEARYQALTLPPEQRAARTCTDEERVVLDLLRKRAAGMRPVAATARDPRLVGPARNHIPREAS